LLTQASGFVWNDSGLATLDLRAEGDTNANLLFVDASADMIGIGTNAPGALLDVRGSAVFNEGGADADFRIEGDTNDDVFFVDASTNRVGIGTTTPSHTMQVVGQVRATSFANADGTSGSPSYRFNSDSNTGMYRAAADTLAFTTGGSERMRIGSTGVVGIGDVDPTNGGLVVASGVTIGSDSTDNLIDDATNGAGSTTLYIGNATIDVTVPSDRRLKENIHESVLSIDDLMAIEMVDFNYNSTFANDTTTVYSGAIAQQVDEVFPQAVSVRSDGYMMIDYKKFIPLLMVSVQDQQAEIDEIKASIAAADGVEDFEMPSDLVLDSLRVVWDAKFEGELEFNSDTVGYATILVDAKNVHVDFESSYKNKPVVTISLMNNIVDNLDYVVKNVNEDGFDIEIDTSYGDDIEFAWHAFATESPKISVSEDDVAQENIVNDEVVGKDEEGSNDEIEIDMSGEDI